MANDNRGKNKIQDLNFELTIPNFDKVWKCFVSGESLTKFSKQIDGVNPYTSNIVLKGKNEGELALFHCEIAAAKTNIVIRESHATCISQKLADYLSNKKTDKEFQFGVSYVDTAIHQVCFELNIGLKEPKNTDSEAVEQLKEQINELKEEKEVLEASVQNFNVIITGMQTEASAKDEKLTASQRHVSKLEQDIEELQNQLSSKSKTIDGMVESGTIDYYEGKATETSHFVHLYTSMMHYAMANYSHSNEKDVLIREGLPKWLNMLKKLDVEEYITPTIWEFLKEDVKTSHSGIAKAIFYLHPKKEQEQIKAGESHECEISPACILNALLSTEYMDSVAHVEMKTIVKAVIQSHMQQVYFKTQQSKIGLSVLMNMTPFESDAPSKVSIGLAAQNLQYGADHKWVRKPAPRSPSPAGSVKSTRSSASKHRRTGS